MSHIFLSHISQDDAEEFEKLLTFIRNDRPNDEIYSETNVSEGISNKTILLSDIVIVFIGSKWSELINNVESRKVVKDLELFLRPSKEKLVLPILFNNAVLPDANLLPFSLSPLRDLKTIKVSDQNLNSDFERLSSQISFFLKSKDFEDSLLSRINQNDRENGVNKDNYAVKRSEIKETEKLTMINLWLKYLEVCLKHHVGNTLVISALENYIDKTVLEIQEQVFSYKFPNEIHVANLLYNSLEDLRQHYISRGINAGARRLYYYEMEALTTLRFKQLIHFVGWKRFRPLVLFLLLKVFKASSDYGQNSLKFSGRILTVILFFGFVFAVSGSFVPNPNLAVCNFTDIASCLNNIPLGIMLSLSNFFTLGGLPYYPQDFLTSFLVLIEFILGYFSLGLFISMITSRIIQ